MTPANALFPGVFKGSPVYWEGFKTKQTGELRPRL
ncbi:protein of unknown function (plasmid) [Caballeronia sp. S22]